MTLGRPRQSAYRYSHGWTFSNHQWSVQQIRFRLVKVSQVIFPYLEWYGQKLFLNLQTRRRRRWPLMLQLIRIWPSPINSLKILKFQIYFKSKTCYVFLFIITSVRYSFSANRDICVFKYLYFLYDLILLFLHKFII